MSIVNDIVQRLTAESTSLKRVERIASLQALLEQTQIPVRSLPAAYVTLAGASADTASITTGSYTQLRTPRFTVVLVVSVVNDASGATTADNAEVLVAETATTLLGWQPQDALTPLVYSRNAEQLIQWRNNLFFYALNLECDTRICI